MPSSSSSFPSTTTLWSAKLISTCGLGLLASYAVAAPLLPLLLTTTTTSTSTTSSARTGTIGEERSSKASVARATLRERTPVRTMGAASFLVGSVLSGSIYGLSPARARHPYLLYSAGLALLSAAWVEFRVVRQLDRVGELGEVEANGEGMEEELGRLGYFRVGAAVLNVLAFLVSAVGNHGDPY